MFDDPSIFDMPSDRDMIEYTAEQVQVIRDAIAKGREAMDRAGRYEPMVFANAYISYGGVQIPGEWHNTTLSQRVAQQLLASLKSGRHGSDDEHLRRELKRVHTEVRWAALAQSDKIVGFYLRLEPAAHLEATCRQLLGEDFGLGAAVFPKTRIVVVPAACSDYEFVPVLEDEVEQ
jgi:hypothetical protein